MKIKLMLAALSILTMSLHANMDSLSYNAKLSQYELDGRQVSSKKALSLCGNDICLRRQIYYEGQRAYDSSRQMIKQNMMDYEHVVSNFASEGGSTGRRLCKAFTTSVPSSTTPVDIPKIVRKVIKQGGDFTKLVAVSSLPSFEKQVSKGTLSLVMDLAKEPVGVKVASTTAKIGGVFAGAAVLGAAYKAKQYYDKKSENERVANCSYFEKAYDSVSDFAKTAKLNTWDSNYYFNHSGKVATIAGVAAVAGLAYVAYKNNPFGKAVAQADESEKTV